MKPSRPAYPILLLTALLLSASPGASAQGGFPGGAEDTSNPPLRATTASPVLSGKSLPPLMPVFQFNENPINHNMHITSDGDFYYTINGGSASSGQVQQFDPAGTLVQTYPISIDGRGISFNPGDGKLYVSTFGGDIVRIDNLATGAYTTLFSSIMQNGQASFALSTDGTRFYDFSQGTLYVRDLQTGAVLDTLTGLLSGTGNYGGEAAVAADTASIYTWNAPALTVYRYDTTGTLLQTFTLSSGDNGHSLAYANSLLFVSKDGNYNTGTWYGYDLSVILGTSAATLYAEGPIYPNPARDRLFIDDPSVWRLEIVSPSGAGVFEKTILRGVRFVDLPDIPAGLYMALRYSDRGVIASKLIIR